jgi:hypothetical protein
MGALQQHRPIGDGDLSERYSNIDPSEMGTYRSVTATPIRSVRWEQTVGTNENDLQLT